MTKKSTKKAAKSTKRTITIFAEDKYDRVYIGDGVEGIVMTPGEALEAAAALVNASKKLLKMK